MEPAFRMRRRGTIRRSSAIGIRLSSTTPRPTMLRSGAYTVPTVLALIGQEEQPGNRSWRFRRFRIISKETRYGRSQRELGHKS